IDMRKPLTPSPVSAAVVSLVRRSVDGVGADRFLAPEMAAAAEIVASGAIVHEAMRAMASTSRGCPLT
ncbi:MAG: histidine ammonia-lyase, partial [Actinomycetota bacterium]